MTVVGVIICIHSVDFLRSTRRFDFPLGILCSKMGLAYSKKGSTVMIPYMCIKGISKIKSSFSWLELVDFDFSQLHRISAWVSLWFPYSSQFSFPVGWSYHVSQPDSLQLLVFQVPWAACLPDETAQGNSFGILCYHVDWVSFCFNLCNCLRIPLSIGVCIYFTRILKCQKPESVVLLFWIVRSEEFNQVASQIQITLRNHAEDCHVQWFNKLEFIRSDYGELGNLCNLLD